MCAGCYSEAPDFAPLLWCGIRRAKNSPMECSGEGFASGLAGWAAVGASAVSVFVAGADVGALAGDCVAAGCADVDAGAGCAGAAAV